MAKFILSGNIVEEPNKRTFGKGVDCYTLLIEEKTVNAFGTKVARFKVDFIGKATKCIPTNVKLVGLPCIVMGDIRTREFKGNFYTNLQGSEITIVNHKTYETEPSVIEKPREQPPHDFPPMPEEDHVVTSTDTIVPEKANEEDITDDDLPF